MRSVATIHLASTYMRITDYYGEFCHKVIMPFCKLHLYKWAKSVIPGTNKQGWKVTHVFAKSNFDKTEYRLPASLMKEFIEYAVRQGYNEARIKIEEEPVITGAPATFKLKKEYETPREHQLEWIDYQLDDGPLKVNNAATGNGKALVNSTPVRTPGGWTPIGELEVGDVVMTFDGSYTNVTGVYPQGITKTFKITFEDGRKALACPEHLWEVREVGSKWETLDTQYLYEKSSKVYEIPLVESERSPRNKSVNDPYEIGYDDKPLLPLLLECSHYQRMAVIRGCMDRAGQPKGDGSICYQHRSLKHLELLQELIWGIGGIAKLVKDGKAYELHIKYRCPADLFTIEAKQNELAWADYQYRNLALKIESIVPDLDNWTTCISVDHPSCLYVIKDYVVTHNTYMALFTMVKLGVRTLVTIQPRYITTWINDIGKMIEIEPEDIIIWENSSLPQLGELISEGKINPKIIILPMTRIAVHLRNCKQDESLPTLDDIFKQINAGYRIIDEGHESFHEISMSMLFGNFKKLLLLSATLKADDPFLHRMYKVMLPPAIRLKEADAENYIDVIAYLYRVNIRKYRIKTMQFGIYNDTALEQSVLNSPDLFKLYCQIAKAAYENFYLDVREPGTKCLFFFSRINMCQAMLEFFKKEYPDMDFDTFLGTLDKKTPTKYLEHEIVITTPGSCGTGKDIPGLVTTIDFHTVMSSQRNGQMIGRLRPLHGKFGGRITPRFVFPVCVDLDKHKECFEKRKVVFAKKIKTFRTLDSHCMLN